MKDKVRTPTCSWWVRVSNDLSSVRCEQDRPCETELLASGIYHCLQIDSVRIESEVTQLSSSADCVLGMWEHSNKAPCVSEIQGGIWVCVFLPGPPQWELNPTLHMSGKYSTTELRSPSFSYMSKQIQLERMWQFVKAQERCSEPISKDIWEASNTVKLFLRNCSCLLWDRVTLCNPGMCHQTWITLKHLWKEKSTRMLELRRLRQENHKFKDHRFKPSLGKGL